MQRQAGFTLIELITVIVILGALAVIALPQYIDLQDEADQAATEGVAGSLGAAAAVNLAGALANSGDEQTVTTCSEVADALADGLPTGYTITGGTIGAPGPTGESASCTLTGPEGSTATFTGYYVS